jgi:hypothetical protein
MAALTGLTIIKAMPYRGEAAEEWSNHYHFAGSVPANPTAWAALFDNVVFYEKACYPSLVHVIGGYGYDSDDPNAHAVWTHDISGSPVAGTLSTSGGQLAPGDAAVWERWKTSRTNSRGKAIYLRKYFHGAVIVEGTTADAVLAAQKTALQALGAACSDGTFGSGVTLRSRTHAETLLSHSASDYVTTRTLKRRGKRPS